MSKAPGESIREGIPIKTIITLIIIALVILYILSPIDLIPDIIPIIGFIDDLVALFIAIGIILSMWKG